MWIYQGEIFTSDMLDNYVSFVYNITNLITGKKYIGKKKFYFKKTIQKKLKKKKIKVESDWKSYFGSNDELKNDVLIHGEENFKREILVLCKSLSECSYYETKFIFESDSLLKPNEYYNSWVSCTCRRKHLIKL